MHTSSRERGQGCYHMRRLVILSGDFKGAAFDLIAPKISVGRDDDNAICMDNTMVSRHHAVLIQKDGDYVVQDNGSSNGTFLNSQPIKSEAALKAGDEVSFGDVRFRYEIAPASQELEKIKSAHEESQRRHRQESDNLQSQLRQVRIELEALRRELAETKSKAASEWKEFQKRSETRESELKKQLDELPHLREKLDLAGKVAAEKALAMEQLKSESEQSRQQWEHQVLEHQKRVAALQVEAATFEEKLTGRKWKEVQQLEASLQEARADLERTTASLKEARLDIQKLLSERERKTDSNDKRPASALEIQVKELQACLAKVRADNEELSKQLSAARLKAAEDLRKATEKSESEIIHLRRQLAAHNGSLYGSETADVSEKPGKPKGPSRVRFGLW
jgi:pSer/pThr/pTyr-binding forkhead associated (FHA) protein